MALNSRQIETFHAVMKTGSVTEAARTLGVTQPAVTTSLKQIETSLGFNLFHRANGRLHPTREAQALFSEAARLQDSIIVFQKLAERLKKDLTTHLRVAAPPAFCHELLPLAIAAFSDMEKDSQIDITTRHNDDILSDLASDVGLNNLGFTFGIDDRPGIGAITMGHSKLLAFIPKKLNLNVTELDILQLQDLPTIGVYEGEPLANEVLRLMEKEGVSPLHKARAHSHAVGVMLACKGTGIAFADSVTAHFARHAYDTSKCNIVPVKGAKDLPITAVYSYEHPLSQKARGFIECFRASLRTVLG